MGEDMRPSTASWPTSLAAIMVVADSSAIFGCRVDRHYIGPLLQMFGDETFRSFE
jgi:hypothetical protein